MISTQSRSARRGFSLIEVAIALVIFVIGALAIIRIFPGALSVIGNNGDQQLATNSNRSLSARLESENAVPSATFNLGVYTTGTEAGELRWETSATANHTLDYQDSGTAVNGIPRFTDSLPNPDDASRGLNNSALSRYRAIQGEPAKVVAVDDDITNNTNVSPYVLTQFPISVLTNGTTITPYAPTISQNISLANIRVKPDGTFDFSRSARTETPDTSNPGDFNTRSLLYVTYRYRGVDGQLWGVREEAVPLPAQATAPNAVDFDAIRVSPPTVGVGAAANNGVVPEIVNIRLKKFISVGQFGPAVGGTDFERVADARRGLVRVALPPNITDITVGSTVSVDYVADWSFMLQDGVPLITPQEKPDPVAYPLPADNQYKQIALGARFIEDRTNVGIYSLLLDPANSKGYRSSFGESTEATSANPDRRLVTPTEDELRNGRVTFISPSIAARVRVAYRTRQQWVQQLGVAAMAYKPFVNRNAEPWRDYAFGNDANDPFLYFHAGEAGKSLLVSYTYDDGLGTPESIKSVTDRPLTIAAEVVDAPGVVDANFSGTRVSRLQLLDFNNQVLPARTTAVNVPKLLSIQSVKGNSVTVRTAYLNGSKYAQTKLTVNRRTN